MFVLSSPSGAGKSTLARLLLSEEPDLILSISVTTRKRRASEVDGQHYYFIDEPAFMRMREHGELLESAEVHGNYYGTPREPVVKALEQGQDVLFDIDWQGTEQLSENAALASDLVRVFVLPPNFRELRSRLERRAEDSSESIRRRLSNARLEIGKWTQYDYVIVNEDLGESYPMTRAILRAERLRRARVVGLDGFVNGLLSEADEAVRDMKAATGSAEADLGVAASVSAPELNADGAEAVAGAAEPASEAVWPGADEAEPVAGDVEAAADDAAAEPEEAAREEGPEPEVEPAEPTPDVPDAPADQVEPALEDAERAMVSAGLDAATAEPDAEPDIGDAESDTADAEPRQT